MLNNNYEKDGKMVYSNDIQVENIELIGGRKEINNIEKDFAGSIEIANEEQTKMDNLLD